MSAVFGMFVGMFVVDLVTLGPLFLPALIATGATILVATLVATILLTRKTADQPPQRSEKRWTAKQKAIGATIGGTLLVTSIVSTVPIGIAQREFQERTNATKAEAAKTTFIIVEYPFDGQRFDAEAVNQTLAELEDSYQKLLNEWETPDTRRMQVHLFRNLDEYQERTGNFHAGGHASCVEGAPLIVIPLEKAPSASSDDNFSRTPTHEIAHGLLCLTLGPEKFRSIPRWYHEGTAQRYEVDGYARIGMRTIHRVKTWLSQDELLPENTFCATRFHPRNEREQSIFYRSSLEFTEHLDARHGKANINLMVRDVQHGEAFEHSMQRRIGATCEEAYSAWSKSF